jgi:hypothetical protein
MNEAVDGHTGQPSTGRALSGGDLAMRPVMTDELSDKGMVRAEQVGRQPAEALGRFLGDGFRRRVRAQAVRVDPGRTEDRQVPRAPFL